MTISAVAYSPTGDTNNAGKPNVSILRFGESIDEFVTRTGVSMTEVIRLNPDYFNSTRRGDTNVYSLAVGVRLRLNESAPPESTIRNRDAPPAPAPVRNGGGLTWWQRIFGGNRDASRLDGAFSRQNAGAPGRIPGIATPAAYTRLISEVAEGARTRLAAVGVSVSEFTALMQRVMYQESRFRPGAESPVGARGLMQVMPDTAAEVARDLGIRYHPSLLDDPAFNVRIGGEYLAKMLIQFNGQIDLAVAAYNAGPNRASLMAGRIPAIAETQDYVAKVLAGTTFA